MNEVDFIKAVLSTVLYAPGYLAMFFLSMILLIDKLSTVLYNDDINYESDSNIADFFTKRKNTDIQPLSTQTLTEAITKMKKHITTNP